MKLSAFSSIEQIDRNFKNQPLAEGLTWLDAFDRRIALRGMGWAEEAIQARSFRRFPDRVVGALREPVQQLSYCPASIFLAFRTNSTEVSVRIANSDSTVMNHMPLTGSAGVELYLRDGPNWVPVATAVPSCENNVFERRLLKELTPRYREYRLYLPLYKRLLELSLGFSPEADVQPLPMEPASKPIVFYGTSITQGGCANTAGSDFVSSVGRLLDNDTINFGFSGNGRGEAEVAELIGEIDAELFVLNYSSNTEVEELKRTLPEFLKILRHKHPYTPIVLQGCLSFNSVRLDPTVRHKNDCRRDTLIRFYLQAKDAGDAHLYFIDGQGLIPAGLTGTFVDGVHPTSSGFAMMAERLAPQLATILFSEKDQ